MTTFATVLRKNMIKQIFLLFLPFYCFSQFSGTVKDSENQPLAGVDVLVSSTMVLAQTDSEGQLSLIHI